MELFITVFIAAIIMIINPGPETMAISGLAAAGKWRSIIIFWLSGITAGTLLYYLALKGFSLIPDNFGLVFIMLKGIAATMFVSIGFSGLAQTFELDENELNTKKEEITNKNVIQTITAGFFLIISNPYNISFILVAIPALTGLQEFSFGDITIIRFAVIAADALVLACYVIPLLFIRNFLNNDLLNKIRIVSSLSMIGVAIFILINMISQWDLEATALL